MKKPAFLIVADRGEMKLFQLKHTSRRPAVFRLKSLLKIAEAHQKYHHRYSDQAGGFPNRGSGGQGNSTAERLGIETEKEARIYRHLGTAINEWLNQESSPAWALAATAPVLKGILKEVDSGHRKNLVQTIANDLVHVPSNQFLSHLEAA